MEAGEGEEKTTGRLANSNAESKSTVNERKSSFRGEELRGRKRKMKKKKKKKSSGLSHIQEVRH